MTGRIKARSRVGLAPMTFCHEPITELPIDETAGRRPKITTLTIVAATPSGASRCSSSCRKIHVLGRDIEDLLGQDHEQCANSRLADSVGNG